MLSGIGDLNEVTLLSLRDPDAPVVRHSKQGSDGVSRPRYKQHRAVDDDYGVITAQTTTPGDIEENIQLEPIIVDGTIIESGSMELAEELERDGYVRLLSTLDARSRRDMQSPVGGLALRGARLSHRGGSGLAIGANDFQRNARRRFQRVS